MSDMFETVNAHADAAHQEELRRREAARRARRADRRMIRVLFGVLAFWVLAVVLAACEQISAGLAEFLATWAAAVLAIWFGAWMQYRFCKKGLMK